MTWITLVRHCPSSLQLHSFLGIDDASWLLITAGSASVLQKIACVLAIELKLLVVIQQRNGWLLLDNACQAVVTTDQSAVDAGLHCSASQDQKAL